MKKGFTLLEMTVVIGVIALLTHLAVRELGAYRDMKLAAKADRQLEDIREATCRFLHDVGRLPRLTAETNDAGEVAWTLSELWKKPDGLVECRLHEKDGVQLAVGWRGPYLKMPFGRGRLLDPWGNPIELEDSAGLRRLWADKASLVTNVCHYGPSAQESACRALSLVPDGGTAATLVVSVDTGAYSGPLECGWYGAYENTVTNETVSLAAAGGQIVFESVPCGVKAVKVSGERTVVRLVDVKGPVTQIGLKVQ